MTSTCVEVRGQCFTGSFWDKDLLFLLLPYTFYAVWPISLLLVQFLLHLTEGA